jgi:hypothetical protein
VLIGIDFDNTIVCYDQVFTDLALKSGVPERVANAGKTAIRDRLRLEGREDEWTVMQGETYGSQMPKAVEFEGVGEFLRRACSMGHRTVIVSHRTTKPYAGPDFDLHAAAKDWWSQRDCAGLVSDVFFETTAENKAARISILRCDVFIDDLWEFLQRPDLPQGIRKIWLDHGGRAAAREGLEKVGSWSEVASTILL